MSKLTSHNINKRYYNISKSTNEFRSFLNRYKTQLKLSKQNENLQKVLDMKKLQVERSETEEEFIIREMKSNQLYLEEIKNTYGSKGITHQNQKDLQYLKSKVESKNKLQKERFFNHYINSKSPRDQSTNTSLSSLKVKKAIILPMIFPNKKRKHIINTENSINKKSKLFISYDPSEINIRPLKKNRTKYLDVLDNLREEYRNMSADIKKYDEEENDYLKKNEAKIKKLKHY